MLRSSAQQDAAFDLKLDITLAVKWHTKPEHVKPSLSSNARGYDPMTTWEMLLRVSVTCEMSLRDVDYVRAVTTGCRLRTRCHYEMSIMYDMSLGDVHYV
ncbi:hypothetical protein EVAR_25124_1 [Eumeta japonica]|uniref:Uncharacterized protein n=1 Tax=Eumeta variegata TaxID=151549 RepID=A0A4C1XLF2_EUMVA|nr:hypothetical protein EVAR_25124_1 [Eumeta japonica]